MHPIEQLHPLEVRVLRHLSDTQPILQDAISAELTLSIGQVNQAISRLLDRAYIRISDTITERCFDRTEYGASLAVTGSIDGQIIAAVQNQTEIAVGNIGSLLDREQREVGPAMGRLISFGVLAVGEDKHARIADPSKTAIIAAIDQLLKRDTSIAEPELSSDQREYIQLVSKKRGAGTVLFRTIESEKQTIVLTTEGLEIKKKLEAAQIEGNEAGSLTSEMLKDGSWKNLRFRVYDVHQPPVRVLLGRTNAYVNYLQEVKDKLVALGFQEFDGPLVETDFWNTDALFMPQFHAARDIHDVYAVKEPQRADAIEEPYFSQVAACHENGWKTESRGWRYTFDANVARRLVLRSQGTVLSAKTLPHADVPGKYFGIVRCFRHDQVDATHLSDFYQVEGIVLGEDVNLCSLLGYLKIFAEEIAGAEEVRYVPGYFPFVEPGVEVHIKHPTLGWFELGGAGIFRSEVTNPLGVTVPVLAWGLGIDRMALMKLRLQDLRDLFTYDLDTVRLRKSHAKN